MIHNDRFLRNTMKATTYHNERTGGSTAPVSSVTVPTDRDPGSKLKVLIRKPGVMGIRLEPHASTGMPCVKAVGPESEAAQQGLTAGYLLKQVFTPNDVIEAKRADYKQLLDLIASLDRPIGLKFAWPGSDKNKEHKKREKKEVSKKRKKDEKVEKKKKKKLMKAEKKDEGRKRRRDYSSSSSNEGQDRDSDEGQDRD